MSKKLKIWANICEFFAVVFFAASIFGQVVNSAWSDGIFGIACSTLILTPLFNGFSVLAKNEEDSLERRARTDSMVENLDEK